MAGFEGDVWRQQLDRSQLSKREPGPIELNRYVVPSGAYAGIPTFNGFPVALTPEDLTAGEVDVAVIAAPIQFLGSTRNDGGGDVNVH